MFLVIARAHCRPDRRDAMIDALREVSVATRAEPGCSSYEFYCSIEDETSFTSVEEWSDRQSADAHFSTPHVESLFGKLPDILASQPVTEIHDVASTTGPPGA